ncbi:MAG: slipin family protein [Desulfuromonadaceae bacterium]
MLGIKKIKIRSYEKGLLFQQREFKTVLNSGDHWFADPLQRTRVDIVSQRDPWLRHDQLDLIVKSGALAGAALVLDLKDDQRALVWIDGRFARVVGPGLHALWTGLREVRTEIVQTRGIQLEHAAMSAILKSPEVEENLESIVVEEGFAAVVFHNGEILKTYGPGRYLFWKNLGRLRIQQLDLRETLIDISGQEILTADNVTLRLNAQLVYRITDPRRAVNVAENLTQALYREAQLALRAIVGTCNLEALLSGKETVAAELERMLKQRTHNFGLEILRLGIRDLILPGEMKELLNQVIQARKAAEANLIVRREETAAMRSQANTARLLESNPTLMRLRELEVLEKVAGCSKLNVILGEKGLAERVVNLL